jgi:oxalate decarboxylase/phosphoglucose isomerase-like protein (cupin superfamily)
LAHVPKEVIARNFKVPQTDLANMPSRQLYIFPGNNSESLEADLAIVKEAGEVPLPYSFEMSKMNATQKEGGSVKIVDSTIFNVSKTIAVAEVIIEPGAMRELHVSTSSAAHIFEFNF